MKVWYWTSCMYMNGRINYVNRDNNMKQLRFFFYHYGMGMYPYRLGTGEYVV